MVAIFVALTITAFVMLDVFLVQRIERRAEVKSTVEREVPEPSILLMEVGVTAADGGEKVEKKTR